jgi:hypothetical protein
VSGQRSETAAAGADLPALQRHDVALEPGQAWCLKGIGTGSDEIIIPGLLLDDLGNCSAIEATLDLLTYYQMLAMVSLQESRMLASRAAAQPDRLRPEANVWLVEGHASGRRLRIVTIKALDRVVVDGYGSHCVETLWASQLLPGPRAWT